MARFSACFFSLVLCGFAVNAVASDPCTCLAWDAVHEAGVPDGAGWEVILKAGQSIYRGLNVGECLLKTTRCIDGEWDSNMNTPLDTWCFVSKDCEKNEGIIGETNYAWKTCATGIDANLCDKSPSELVELISLSSKSGVVDPTKLVAWACPYSNEYDVNTIAAETGSAHMVGCGFNSENAPTVTSIATAQVVNEKGCSQETPNDGIFSDIVDMPGTPDIGAPDVGAPSFEPPGIDIGMPGMPSNPSFPRSAALIQQGKVNIDEVHNAVGVERAKLLRRIDSSGATKLVPAGVSEKTVDSPDTCATPHSVYLIGHGQIYFCQKNGPLTCECETGCP